MKIISFQAENVKRLKAVLIKPESNVVLITGANGQGKSSVLDSIWMALGGKEAIPSRPVRDGEEKAHIRLDLGEIIVIRKFTANGGTSLIVEAANGAKFPSPQKMLDDMLGALTFDPLEFSRMPAKQQLETLRKMVKVSIDLDTLDAETKAAYEQRTVLNRDIKKLEARLPVAPVGPPAVFVDVTAKMRELDNATKLNARIFSAKQYVQRLNDEMANYKKQILSIEGQMEIVIGQLQRATDELMSEVDTTPLVQEIESAQNVNALVSLQEQRKTLAGEIFALHSQTDDLDTLIADNGRAKAEAIAAAEFPVDGLSFGNDEVLFNDVPFSQASSAEQLKVSVGIAMAANPKLRVLRIAHGEMLDSASMSMLEFMAEMNDFQMWVEKMDESGALGVVIEDGEVIS